MGFTPQPGPLDVNQIELYFDGAPSNVFFSL